MIVPRLLLVVLTDHTTTVKGSVTSSAQSRPVGASSGSGQLRGLGSKGQDSRMVDSLVKVLSELGPRAVELGRLRQVLSLLGESVHYLLCRPRRSRTQLHVLFILIHSMLKHYFNPAAENSFISNNFVKSLDRPIEMMDVTSSISSPFSGPYVVNQVVRLCEAHVGKGEITLDLMNLSMRDLDVIIGMDYLSLYRPNFECFEKVVTFQPLGRPQFQFVGDRKVIPPPVMVSASKARRLKRHGC